MCGRIGLPHLTWRQFMAWQRGELDWDDLYREPGAEDAPRRYNVKPTDPVEILFADGRRLCSTSARWWFVPDTFNGRLADWKSTTFNARIETADFKPTFRAAWHTGRCVVPVTGYFEWTGAKGFKQPWWISAQSNAPCLYLAGLQSRLVSGLRTATILTRPALSQIAHIHPRTPVILSHDEIWPWVTGAIQTDEAKQTLGTAWDGRMSYHKVDPFGAEEDGPQLIEPIPPDLFGE